MKILWIINTILPFPSNKIGIKSTVFGGWLNSLLDDLIDSNEIKKIAIATVYNGENLLKFTDKKITYYLIPCKNKNKYDKKIEKYWQTINEEFKPDKVHIHGTEFPHSLAYLNACPNSKTIVSIQGLISVCGKKEIYNAGLTIKDMITNITLRDIVKKDLLLFQAKQFRRRGKYEKEILKKCNAIIGRTSFDKAYSYNITNESKYEFCNESLRNSFYLNEWKIDKIEKHSIFISQASYPIKGFHIVLKAAKELKKKYSDLKIYVAGNDILKDNKSFKEKIKMSGYGKLIKKLIKKYKLQDNIEFLGLLTEEEICQKLLSSNVFVQASSIENSPNSLGEAMILGLPCVASYVGGTPDMLYDKKEGFLYPFGDYCLLQKYITDIFENQQLAIEIGRNARLHAQITHSKKINTNKMIKIYKK